MSFWDDWGEVIIAIVVVVVIIGCMLGGAVMYERAQCYAKTQSMGFESKWSLLGTCQIEVTPGKWIPLDTYYFKQE